MKSYDPYPKIDLLEDVDHFDNVDEDDSEDTIISNFVPAPLPASGKEHAIANTLDRLQANDILSCGKI